MFTGTSKVLLFLKKSNWPCRRDMKSSKLTRCGIGLKISEPPHCSRTTLQKHTERKLRPLVRQKFVMSYLSYMLYCLGWPPAIEALINQNGMNHPDTQQAINTYMENWATMGIVIRPEFVEKNPARRNFAKLVLNK